VAFQLTIVARPAGGPVEIRAEGEITARDFPTAEYNPLEKLLGADWNASRILMDCEAMPYIDSSALGWLISSQKALRNAGGILVLHSIQSQVRQLFSMLKIGRVVTVADNLSTARLLVQTQPA
jgi:anti-anti-sigma factor